MPKEIKSAAEILGDTPPEGQAPEVASAPPPAPEPALVPEAAPAAPSGFETPPPAEEEPATAAQVLTASGSLAQAAPPPSAPAPTIAREFVQPAKPETLPPVDPTIVEAPKAAPAPAEKTQWNFVKNIHPGETIVFEDKTTYVLRAGLTIVRDPVLAKKILAVASRYNIVEQ